MNSNYQAHKAGLTLQKHKEVYMQRLSLPDASVSLTMNVSVGDRTLTSAGAAWRLLKTVGAGRVKVVDQPPLEQCFHHKHTQRQAVILKNKDKDERWKKLNNMQKVNTQSKEVQPICNTMPQKLSVQGNVQSASNAHVSSGNHPNAPAVFVPSEGHPSSTLPAQTSTDSAARNNAQTVYGQTMPTNAPLGHRQYQNVSSYPAGSGGGGSGPSNAGTFAPAGANSRGDSLDRPYYGGAPSEYGQAAPQHDPTLGSMPLSTQRGALGGGSSSNQAGNTNFCPPAGKENRVQEVNRSPQLSGSGSSFSNASRNSKYFQETSSAPDSKAEKMQKLAEAGWDDFDFRELVSAASPTPMVPKAVTKSPIRNALTELVQREKGLEAATSTTFDWAQVYEINREVYGHRSFRPGQVSAIYHSLMGKDVFVLMPTGGGKSLCYQVPSLVQGVGISIVVSPLVSLVHDQVQGLKACGVEAACLLGSGRQTQEEYTNVMSGVYQGRIKLLYVTPEKLAQSGSFMSTLDRLYQKQHLGRFVIDEAHCVSNWGHDFRSDYLKLSVLKKSFPQVPMMALTATANRRVIQDIIKVLGLRNPEKITLSFNRKNLHYQILPKKGFKSTIDSIVSYVKSRSKDCGIVYCLSRKETENVAQALQAALGAHAVSFYHAGIEDPEERQLAQDKWSKGRAKVIVATIAFGMGINKPNVRYVIHFCMPKSITNFYQESGRGGRDGLVANSILYYSYGDKLKIERMLKRGNTADGSRYGKRVQSHTIQLQMENLRRMTAFCMNQIDCRRKLILEYFGETFDPSLCKQTCDNCQDTTTKTMTDVTEEARLMVSLVADCQNKRQNLTLTTMIGILRGTSVKGAFAAIDNYSSARSLTTWSKDDLTRLTHQLVLEAHLEEVEVTNRAGFPTVYIQVGHKRINKQILMVVLKANKRSRKVRKKEPLDVDAPSEKRRKSTLGQGGSAKGIPAVVEETLLLTLTQYTDDYAEKNKIKSWNVFDEKTVTEMARRVPRTIEELKDINGVAKRKIDTHGAHILAIINSSLQKLKATDLPPFQFRQDADEDLEDQDFIIIE